MHRKELGILLLFILGGFALILYDHNTLPYSEYNPGLMKKFIFRLTIIYI